MTPIVARKQRSAKSWLTSIARIPKRYQVAMKKIVWYDYFAHLPYSQRCSDFDDALAIWIEPEDELTVPEFIEALVMIGHTREEAEYRTRGMDRTQENALRREQRRARRMQSGVLPNRVYKRRAIKC